ncbi:MAG: GMC family oxidoreductase [Planctomycetota bacterium]
MRCIASHDLSKTYDYIVVGSGAAGSILASLIVSKQLGSVLLIEAGAMPTSRRLKIPSQYPLAFGTSWDWCHQTSPQSGLAGRRLSLPSGKALGGSTAINAMIYIEPPSEDWNRWSQSAGTRWSPKEVAPYFEQNRRYLDQLHSITDEPNSIGPLPSQPELHPVTHRFFHVAIENGWVSSTGSREESDRTPRQPVLHPFLRLQSAGRRVSTWAMLQRRLRKSNSSKLPTFHVLTDTIVNRVACRNNGARSVVFKESGEQITIDAERGIILCAGALSTPRLLLQSGIGPVEWLKDFGIPLQQEAPTLGQNLQDHLIFPMIFQCVSGPAMNGNWTRDDRVQYVQSRSGPLASNLAELGGAFDSTSDPYSGLCTGTNSDFQWHITPTHYLDYPISKSDVPHVSIGLTRMRPSSRGSLRPAMLRGQCEAGPSIAFEIDPGYLSAPDERDVWLKGIEWTRQFFSRAPWQQVLAKEILPGSKRSSPQASERSLRHLSTTLYHYAGTCAMGTDRSATVDPQLRVRGVDRLWVCDASIMPSLTSCNPQATIMMLAHRLAEELAQES